MSHGATDAPLTKSFQVEHGRRRVSRFRADTIEFACITDDSGLSSITITFPGDTETLARLVQALVDSFGPFLSSGANGGVEEAGLLAIRETWSTRLLASCPCAMVGTTRPRADRPACGR